MKRSRTTKNLFDKRTTRRVALQDPIFEGAIGPAERKGLWLLYGNDKNGKTWFALRLAKDLAATERVAYISAEEGLDDSFVMACTRAGITREDRLLIDEYMPYEAIIEKYQKPRTANVIFIDNLTMYQDEMKPSHLVKLAEALPKKLIILIGHEERNEPYPASARMAKKLAKVYVNVKGLKAFVVSRFASQPGEIVISPELSEMYWGSEENKQNNLYAIYKRAIPGENNRGAKHHPGAQGPRRLAGVDIRKHDSPPVQD